MRDPRLFKLFDMNDYLFVGILGILLSIGFGVFVIISRKTNARQKSLDRKATRDEIIAARKRMKRNGGSSEIDNPLVINTQRDMWFTVFLYCIIAFIIFIIINNIVVITKYDSADGLNEVAKGFMVIQIILYVIEVFLYVLFLFKMKKKIAVIYVILMILSLFIGVFTLNFISIIRIVPIYFVFKSQWHNFA